jgi:hypothetical protein
LSIVTRYPATPEGSYEAPHERTILLVATLIAERPVGAVGAAPDEAGAAVAADAGVIVAIGFAVAAEASVEVEVAVEAGAVVSTIAVSAAVGGCVCCACAK